MAIGISSVISPITSEDTDMGGQRRMASSGGAYLLNPELDSLALQQGVQTMVS